MSYFPAVKRFLVEKFWRPIADESVFYNPYNTAVYSGLFAVLAAYIGFPALKKMDIDLNREFFLGITPFVFLGGAVRSLKDIDVLNTFLLETPFIYIIMFGFTFLAIYLSKKIDKTFSIPYHKTLGSIGLIAFLSTLPFYSINNSGLASIIVFIASIWLCSGYLLLKIFQPGLLRPSFTIPVSAHFLDATVTAAAVGTGNAVEKHVLGQMFIDTFGPFGMFLMKGLIIVPAVLYIINNVEGEEKRYYLFLIALLGIGITTRNMLSIITLS